jgi:hypothetical protein
MCRRSVALFPFLRGVSRNPVDDPRSLCVSYCRRQFRVVFVPRRLLHSMSCAPLRLSFPVQPSVGTDDRGWHLDVHTCGQVFLCTFGALHALHTEGHQSVFYEEWSVGSSARVHVGCPGQVSNLYLYVLGMSRHAPNSLISAHDMGASGTA